MEFLKGLQAKQRVAKLREARSLDAKTLRGVQDALVAAGPASIPSLLECLSHGDARGPAIDALERLVSGQTMSQLVAALSSPNPAISSGVAKAMAKCRRLDVARILGLLTGTKPPKPLLESILREHVASIPAERLLRIFPQLLKDGQAVVFRILEKTENSSVTGELSRLLGHSDWWVRMNAIRLLAAHPDDDVVAAITARLEDENRTVRAEAMGALQRLRATPAIPAVVARLRDSDYMVQSAAVDFLVAHADASAVPQLLVLLAEDSEYVRRAAVEVLTQIATVDAIQHLVRVLRDQDWWVRVRAADALGALGGEKVVEAMLPLLQDSDESIRRHAVEILHAVPDARAVEALVAALDDPDGWVRQRAIETLGKTGDARAVEPLLRVLASEEGAVPSCARALAEIGDPRAIAPLCLWAESDQEEIRYEACEALKSFLRRPISAEHRAEAQAALGRSSATTGAPRGDWTPSPIAALPRPAGRLDGGLPPAPAPMRRAVEPSPAAAPIRSASGAVQLGVVDVNQLASGSLLLDRYRIVRKIGRGGYGAVYLVEDAAIQDEVVLKILNPQLSFDENARLRFVRELKLTRRITHKNVIRLHDLLDLGGAHAVSMEYFAGEDLGQILAREGRLGWERSLRLIAQVCEGLEVAHEMGILHRDLKPANILVGEGDAVKILDFGLASPLQQADARLTKSGLLIGTPEYMAPEQIAGDQVDARADIYSLGIMLYEMLSGMKPYTDETPVKVLFRHLEGDATPLAEVAPTLPAGLALLVSRAMARDVADRPPSVVRLREEIEVRLRSLAERN